MLLLLLLHVQTAAIIKYDRWYGVGVLLFFTATNLRRV